jgi:para-aminobenzoate synthetase
MVDLPSSLELRAERLDALIDPERVFADLYGESAHAFWLDSSKRDERSRFSFMGDDDGPLAAVITYDVATRTVTVVRGGRTETTHQTIFDYLRSETVRLRGLEADLPFDFDCGFAGYLGYELKADCGGEGAYAAPGADAAFVFADRMIAFDHEEQRTYLICLTDTAGNAASEQWIATTTRRLLALAEEEAPAHARAAGGDAASTGHVPVAFRLARSRDRYLEDIAVCKQRLLDGETYEVCLTNQIVADIDPAPDPLTLYRTLRRVNPAPFAAFLRFGDTAVLSSSPERLLRVGRDRWAEAKPIKGTARRGATPADDVRLAEQLRSSEKNRAENLMITDLLRNDLGRVCQIGTVHVPHLMQVETYETVHQLVSTVRGLLRPGVEAPDAVRACFPPGSMTGAPKQRTMTIIDSLEQAPRGVYSGAVGYFGVGGACDLSVVIRTIVIEGGSTSIGVGGAIVIQSDPEEEFDEALLKGAAPMRAIDPRADESALVRVLDSK